VLWKNPPKGVIQKLTTKAKFNEPQGIIWTIPFLNEIPKNLGKLGGFKKLREKFNHQ